MVKFSIQAYTNLLLTYLGKKFGEETDDFVLPEGVKPGSRVYLIVSDPLTKKDAALQRFVSSFARDFLVRMMDNVFFTSWIVNFGLSILGLKGRNLCMQSLWPNLFACTFSKR